MVCTQLTHVLDVGVRGVGEVKVRTFGVKEKSCLHNKNTILRMSYVFCMELSTGTNIQKCLFFWVASTRYGHFHHANGALILSYPHSQAVLYMGNYCKWQSQWLQRSTNQCTVLRVQRSTNQHCQQGGEAWG